MKRWRSEHLDLDVWLKEYSVRRYGVEDENLKEAWTIFIPVQLMVLIPGHRRPSESVFCAPPSLKRDKITASAWSQCRIFYDPELFAQGVGLFLQSADRLKQTSTYQYDAVDFVPSVSCGFRTGSILQSGGCLSGERYETV